MATEDVYATLLLNDLYLPGALVLGHSLRDAGTTKKLAVLVTVDSVSADAMAELRRVFDYLLPVERIVNTQPGNLALMDRVDLHSAFTKIVLWKQLQFRRVVYMDADMVAWRAPDELFDIDAPFSAAPDIGWPDLFNTGLMVLKPNMGDYWALHAMAQRGISFDGADQGLLNMHFKNTYNRLSFSYNVTPSAHYQYIPAYRHFQSSISAVHFIGKDKPWTQGREASRGTGPYNEITGRWWAVYDRHYRSDASAAVQYYVKGELKPKPYSYDEQKSSSSSSSSESSDVEPSSIDTADNAREVEAEQTSAPADPPKQDFVAPSSEWDPARFAPPADSKPEAANFPSTQYAMSSDPNPYKAPARYPDPPKDMWYEVPKTPTYQKPTPIFPWEKNAPKPTRVFAEDQEEQRRPSSSGSVPSEEEVTHESFGSSTRNAWDDIPEIERYIGALQKNRKGNIQVLQGYGAELERPSLPVTPAPVRRPSFWGTERDEEGELPAAEGVPAQADWDPVAQLDALVRRQSEVLGKDLDIEGAKEIPSRPLPFGSEGIKAVSPKVESPRTSSPRTAESKEGSAGVAKTNEEEVGSLFEKPAYAGPNVAWEKDESFPTRETPAGPTEEEMDAFAE